MGPWPLLHVDLDYRFEVLCTVAQNAEACTARRGALVQRGSALGGLGNSLKQAQEAQDLVSDAEIQPDRTTYAMRDSRLAGHQCCAENGRIATNGFYLWSSCGRKNARGE